MRKSNYDKMPATVVDGCGKAGNRYGSDWRRYMRKQMDHKFGWWNATKGFITRS